MPFPTDYGWKLMEILALNAFHAQNFNWNMPFNDSKCNHFFYTTTVKSISNWKIPAIISINGTSIHFNYEFIVNFNEMLPSDALIDGYKTLRTGLCSDLKTALCHFKCARVPFSWAATSFNGHTVGNWSRMRCQQVCNATRSRCNGFLSWKCGRLKLNAYIYEIWIV